MISYCIACFRPVYSMLLIEDLAAKTTAKYEILVWLNLHDERLEKFLTEKTRSGYPVKIVGKSPENIGMQALLALFRAAQYELIVQIDDDVVMVSKRIAEWAGEIFGQFKTVRQLVADVWQDEFTTGARPPMEHYRRFSEKYDLYDGPVDGWFSIYHRSILPVVNLAGQGKYFYLGGMVKQLLQQRGLQGLLCRKMKVFHVIGPQYASYFDMLDFEIQKYQRLGRYDIVQWYEQGRENLPDREILSQKIAAITTELNQ